MSKWVVCINGHGQGCDYTIGCNSKFYETEADSLQALIDKLNYDFANLKDVKEYGETPQIYMSGFEKYPENVYDKVYVACGELVDISDKLREKIKDMISEKEKEDSEYELYKKLKEKYT